MKYGFRYTVLFLLLCILSLVGCSQSQENYTYVNVNYTLFVGGVSSKEVENHNNIDCNLEYNDGKCTVAIRQHDSNILYEAPLLIFPSVSDYFAGKAVIGIPEGENLSDKFELSCFRIEKEADSLTLMEYNYDLMGKQVIFLGIRDKVSRDIYYFQTALDSVSFEDLIQSSEKNLMSSDYTEYELAKTEDSYLTMIDR